VYSPRANVYCVAGEPRTAGNCFGSIDTAKRVAAKRGRDC
jgi:hypothetical protein